MKIDRVDITEVVQEAYLEYAMSVIVSRAIPDVRDGLKPVQRRILYGMYELGVTPNVSYKKSARIVGEVLGKYHPHGDGAVYDAMARMAQPFTMRCVLIDGQGNFGSIDGDAPAAMRYTEARLTPAAMELLHDIEKNAVEWSSNFDGTLKEPDYLPARIPNLLLNGSSGIAVGMSTNIPPHNLGELIDALVLMLEQKDWDKITVHDIMRFVKGPDFPTGGIIQCDENENNLVHIYTTGNGHITVRARTHIEPRPNGKQAIIVTEIPYQTNKAAIIESIADLIRTGKLSGISDLRDESDRRGMRIVIEITRGINPNSVLQNLYRHTSLESHYGVNLLALVNNEPQRLSLKKILQLFIEHRIDVVTRQINFDLNRASKQAHILDGILKVLTDIDDLLTIIKTSPSVEIARQTVCKRFNLSDEQARAVLDLPLKKLTTLEIEQVKKEYNELMNKITEWKKILEKPDLMRRYIKSELLEIKEKYASPRCSEIVFGKGATSGEDDNNTNTQSVAITNSGEGIVADKLNKIEHSVLRNIIATLKISDGMRLMAVYSDGKAAIIAPVIQRTAKHTKSQVSKFKLVPAKNNLVTVLPLYSEPSTCAIVTAHGFMSIIDSTIIHTLSEKPQKIIDLDRKDWVVSASIIKKEDDILLATSCGMGLRFSVESAMKSGVNLQKIKAIKLSPQDRVVSFNVITENTQYCMFITNTGEVKKIASKDIGKQRHGNKGFQIIRMREGINLVGMVCSDAETTFLLVSENGHQILKSKMVQSGDKEIQKVAQGDFVIRAIPL